jgi:hypothetical protein
MAIKDLFALAGTISVDSSGAIQNIDKATDAAERSEGKFESAFKNIAAAAVTYLSATAIWNFGKSMVEAAAEVQAETAQFDAAFKDLSGSATEAFGRIEESTGTLSTRLQVVGTKAFSQFKGAGMDATDALATMEDYLNLAADGAAYYDMSLEETDELLRSFIRGNTEAGDRLGLFTSETQRNEKAMDMYGKKFLELTEDQKQFLMLDIAKGIYEQSGATGQAAREADGYANVTGNLKEQWRQFMAQAGTPILQALIPILQGLGGVIQSITPFVTWLTTKLIENKDVVVALGAGLLAAGVAFGAITAAMKIYQGVMTAVKAVQNAYRIATIALTMTQGGATTATKLLTTAQLLLNKAFKANPIGIVITIIGALVAAFIVLWNRCEGFRNFWKKIWAEITKFAKQAWTEIKKVWDKVKPYFQAIWNAIKSAAKIALDNVKFAFSLAWQGIKLIWNNAKAYFQLVWNTIRGIFKVVKSVLTGDFRGAWDGIKSIFSGVGQFFRNIVSNIVNAFSNIGSKIANKFKGLGGKIASAAGKVWSGAKKLLGFAGGGVFTGESAIRVAEYPNATTNPEIVTPQRIMRDTFADTLEKYNLKAADGAGSSRVEALLEQLIALFGQQKVVLSTGELVGALTPRMDKALGDRSAKKERGRV